MSKYIMAIDQGTTSSRAIIFDRGGNIISVGQREFRQIYPNPGWVEHDPFEILESEYASMKEAVDRAGISCRDIAAIGITNQRETAVVWDRRTGKPIYNAIVWQCRRTAKISDTLKAANLTDTIYQKTGLIIDAYFSATKIKWLIDNIDCAKRRAENGDLIFGTIESWLIWNLTGGKRHLSDYSNASRTMLFNINDLCWDKELCDMLDIPISMLPEAVPNSYDFGCVTGNIKGLEDFAGIPICGAAGDQQAALLGQGCISKGDTKSTYGTGCFALMNTGSTPVKDNSGLVTTVAWNINGSTSYALEGSVFNAGSTIQWLRDELEIISSAHESDLLAESVPDNGGVYLVPAFTGLGAPYWDMYARGTIQGLTRGTGRSHIIRAALESIAYQTRDVLEAMEADTQVDMGSLRVDGGAARNHFLMQFQADILNCRVELPEIVESTAMGAALLAGLAVGFWKDKEEARASHRLAHVYEPQMSAEERAQNYSGWKNAVAHTLTK